MELGAQKNQKQNKNEKKRVLHAVKWKKKSSKCTKMKILINQIFENGMVFRRQLHNTKWIIWKTIFLLYVIYRPNAKHVLLFFHYYSVLLLPLVFVEHINNCQRVFWFFAIAMRVVRIYTLMRCRTSFFSIFVFTSVYMR